MRLQVVLTRHLLLLLLLLLRQGPQQHDALHVLQTHVGQRGTQVVDIQPVFVRGGQQRQGRAGLHLGGSTGPGEVCEEQLS